MTYGSKKKTYSGKALTENKFCHYVLRDLMRKGHAPYNTPFLEAVDPEAMGIPHYRTVIKTPMDLSTVDKKLENGDYETAEEFQSDIRLIFSNCYTFNPPGSPVFNFCTQLEAAFNGKWSEKNSFMQQHGESSGRNRGYDGESSADEYDGNI
jgi:bromodomain-containing factor 1